ncbi:MAG: fused MFS/spermidine synthase [Nitrospirae bacterium]|nr:fused MFS/spermidine synthase [Nitrospirota bacterium]
MSGNKSNGHGSTVRLRSILFALFFLSGFAGLLYQVVWLRMAYASFGIITPVLSVVISVFMLGLAVGSLVGGATIDGLCRKTGLSPVYYYAIAECCIGVGAFVVPLMFRWGSGSLLMSGEMDSVRYLLLSALVIIASILPWCVLMGFTFPFMMSFVKDLDKSNKTGFSFLYLANVIGAMSGTIVTAYVLVELLGLRKTWMVAACVNFLIAAISVALGIKYPYGTAPTREIPEVKEIIPDTTVSSRQALLLLFTTGFTSMSLEVIWIRAFTPAFGTSIYTFAIILAVYLFATAAGSFLYRDHLKSGRVYDTFKLITLLGISVFLPIVLSDWRLTWAPFAEILYKPLVLLTIIPYCTLLGYLTPKLIDVYSEGRPSSAGYAYCLNIIGCIAGPCFASYVFLQYLGIHLSMVAMAVPFVLFFISYLLKSRYWTAMSKVAATVIIVLSVISTFYSKDHENYHNKDGNMVARDHTATVVARGKGMGKQLIVNGIGITHLTPITKNMAHLPMIFLNRHTSQESKPISALIICFGMGTTHRSMLSWNVKSTAVELIPSVRTVFPYFFDNARTVIENPNGRIVIDDGRRFLNRTSEKYDIITIDPPPPVEAAGSSLLYSEDFYTVIKAHLKEGGIFQQWVPTGEKKIMQAILRSIVNSFPYIRAYVGAEGWGLHFIASLSPINIPQIEEIEAIMPDSAKKDFTEWPDNKDFKQNMDGLLSKEVRVSPLLNDNRHILINDNKPYNEYYFLRRLKASIKLRLDKLLN